MRTAVVLLALGLLCLTGQCKEHDEPFIGELTLSLGLRIVHAAAQSALFCFKHVLTYLLDLTLQTAISAASHSVSCLLAGWRGEVANDEAPPSQDVWIETISWKP
eukprot:scaffold114065_cov19-Tisochrysis_lutea.AAC.1